MHNTSALRVPRIIKIYVVILNYDFKISERAYKSKMTINLDSNKQALNVPFFRKTFKINHPELVFYGDSTKKPKQKHLTLSKI